MNAKVVIIGVVAITITIIWCVKHFSKRDTSHLSPRDEWRYRNGGID